MRLFCFPYAGGGAPAYRLWPQHLGDQVELVAFHPAGRGHRLREAPLDSIEAMVAETLAAFEPLMDRPFAFFGHSLGAIVASEATRVLQEQGRAPVHLFISARLPERKPEAEIHHLPEAEFVDAMNRRYQGIPAEVMAHPELLELLIPPLRADIRALERFNPPAGREKIAAPTTVFGATHDRQVPVAGLEAWRNEAVDLHQIRTFAGDHFYIDPQRQALVAEITATLAPHLAAGKPVALDAR